MDTKDLTLDINQHIDIQKSPEAVFEGLLLEFSEKMCCPDGRSMNMHLERKPGGRWFRDLGDGTGHLWGFVQTLKPPVLLEITGPMFMSYPVTNHLEARVSEIEGGARITLRHRALGLLQEDHKAGVTEGWRGMLEAVKKSLES